MHKRTLYSACTTACDAHADSRTRHTKCKNAARGHIAFSHFGDAAAILSARGLVHKRWHASISQGSCICTSYTSVTYDMHMHICTRCTLYTCACRTAQNPCQKRASLMQHCMVAASRVDPIWPKLVFSATADCALHPYVSTTYGDRYHIHISKVEFLCAAGEKVRNWEVKRSNFSEKMAIRTT